MTLSIPSLYSASSRATRLFNLDNNFSVKLDLIDSLGNGISKQTVYNDLPPCDAVLLVYDITRYGIGYAARNLSIGSVGGCRKCGIWSARLCSCWLEPISISLISTMLSI
jgi:hypothetical protein